MAFDFSNLSGEAFGDINDVFMKKDGKSIVPTKDTQAVPAKVSVADITKELNDTAQNTVLGDNKSGNGTTIINISKDVIDGEEDIQVSLTQLEERRRNGSSIKNKHYIDINNGEGVKVVEHTEMYNGTTLLTVKQEKDAKLVTYPRGMFVGKKKQFVPKEYYIREAERAIEDTIDRFHSQILVSIQNHTLIEETSDGKFLELVLEEPIDIIGGILVPDKIQIPVKRMFDLEYKIMMLENVICMDNKIAGLLFFDIWF